MKIKNSPIVLDLEVARVLLSLGSSVAEFRRSIEVSYVGAFNEMEEANDRSPVIPEFIDHHLANLRKCLDVLVDELTQIPTLASNVKQLIPAAEEVRRIFEECWMDKQHKTLLREREEWSEKTDGGNGALLDYELLQNSPFKPRSWEKYSKAFDALMHGLSTPYSEWLELAHVLTRIVRPLCSEYDQKAAELQLMNEGYLRNVIGPRVIKLFNTIESSFPLLSSLPTLSRSAYSYKDACLLHKTLVKKLRRHHSDQPQLILPIAGAAETPNKTKSTSKRGRRPIDLKRDAQIFDGWQTGEHGDKSELAKAFDLTIKEVNKALDRERKRRK